MWEGHIRLMWEGHIWLMWEGQVRARNQGPRAEMTNVRGTEPTNVRGICARGARAETFITLVSISRLRPRMKISKSQCQDGDYKCRDRDSSRLWFFKVIETETHWDSRIWRLMRQNVSRPRLFREARYALAETRGWPMFQLIWEGQLQLMWEGQVPGTGQRRSRLPGSGTGRKSSRSTCSSPLRGTARSRTRFFLRVYRMSISEYWKVGLVQSIVTWWVIEGPSPLPSLNYLPIYIGTPTRTKFKGASPPRVGYK